MRRRPRREDGKAALEILSRRNSCARLALLTTTSEPSRLAASTSAATTVANDLVITSDALATKAGMTIVPAAGYPLEPIRVEGINDLQVSERARLAGPPCCSRAWA